MSHQRWTESSGGTALVFLHGHTQSKRAYTSENAEQTEPMHPRGHGPTRACSYAQMYPKSVWKLSDASYLAADNDTHQLWTVSFSSGTFLLTQSQHPHLQKKMYDDDCSNLSCIPQTSHIFNSEKKKKSFVEHFSRQRHILSWLVLGSGRFILVARRNPHMVDSTSTMHRPYQQNQTWNLGQGCPVMTEFIFPCPHVFSIWPCSICAPSLHKPRGDSRKPHCTSLGLNMQRDPLWLI